MLFHKNKISVIVPVYKVEKYLKQCVDSILSQTYKNLEIILIDDGSPDNCPKIIDEYAKKDRRIIAVHQKNGGYGKAVNHGLGIAKGKYIAIVEPDDYIAPDMYESLIQLAIETDADIIKSSFYRVVHFLGKEDIRSAPRSRKQEPAGSADPQSS